MNIKNSQIDIIKGGNTKNIVILIGIGIFGWIAIGSFAYLFKYSIKDLFLNLSIQAVIIFWTSEITNLLIYIFGILILVNIVKNSAKSELMILVIALILLVIVQILQYIEPIINNHLGNEKYFENSIKYNAFLKENSFYFVLSPIFGIIAYILTAIIILVKGIKINKQNERKIS